MKGFRPRVSREKIRANFCFAGSIVLALYALSMVALLIENYSPHKSLFFESLMALRETSTRLVNGLGEDFVDPLAQQSYLAQSDLPRLDLYLAPQNLERLRLKRDQAARDRVLITEAGDEVPGRLRLDNQKQVRVRVRLKGDNTDHLLSSIWSLRITVGDGDTLLGMRRFSLQRPGTRGGHTEAMLLRQLRLEDILAPRYRYVDLLLNDRFVGTVALEEHFSKELLESQGRRESVILAFDEDYMWRQRRVNRREDRTPVAYASADVDSTQFDPITMLPLKVFQEKKVLSNPALRKHYQEAIGVARGYLAGNLDSEQVFDMQRVGRFMALLHLWCVDHGLVEHNLRLYYNPVTRLFEPIGFDNHVPKICPADPAKSKFPFTTLFGTRGSAEFVRSYALTAERMNDALASGELTSRLEGWESELLRALEHTEDAGRRFPMSRLATRARYMVRHLPTVIPGTRFHPYPPTELIEEPELSGFFTALYVEQDDAAHLEIHNVTDRPIRLDALVRRTADGDLPFPLTEEQRVVGPVMPFDAWPRIPVPRVDIELGERYHVRATFEGRNHQDEVARVSFPAFSHAKYTSPSISEFLDRFDFVVRSGPRELTITPGIRTIIEDMIVPAGYMLRISPATNLQLCPSCRLVVRGPLLAVGTPEEPIVFSGIERDARWGGLVVLGARDRSRLEHVRIEHVSYPTDDDWHLTGAVTFHESDVSIVSSTFAGNRTEDALNVIRSEFAIHQSSFLSSAGDAVDIDFGNGVISESRFEETGGDGLDVSGSRLRVSDSRILRAADKAISVGESSMFIGSRMKIDDAYVAIAAKDASTATLIDSRIEEVDGVAYISFIKKPEYGPAELIVIDTTLRHARLEAAATPSCVVTIDGRAVRPTEVDLGQLYTARAPRPWEGPRSEEP